MHLDHGARHGRKGVADRHGGMRVGAGVDDDPRAVADVLDHVDQLSLAVALAAVHVEPQTIGVCGAARLDVGEGL